MYAWMSSCTHVYILYTHTRIRQQSPSKKEEKEKHIRLPSIPLALPYSNKAIRLILFSKKALYAHEMHIVAEIRDMKMIL